MNSQNAIHQTSAFHDVDAAKAGVEPAFVAPTSFQHITLGTGHSCMQPREVVATAVAATLSQVIAEGLANGGWTDLKRFGDDCALHISVSGSALLAELYLPCKNPLATKPAIRIGVSAGPSAGADTWKHLRTHAPGVGPGVLSKPPAEPWIGVVVNLSPELVGFDIKQLVAYAAMMQWAGDFERCLAWGFVTWLEATSRRN